MTIAQELKAFQEASLGGDLFFLCTLRGKSLGFLNDLDEAAKKAFLAAECNRENRFVAVKFRPKPCQPVPTAPTQP